MFLEKSLQITMFRIAILEAFEITEREFEGVQRTRTQRATVAQSRNAAQGELAVRSGN